MTLVYARENVTEDLLLLDIEPKHFSEEFRNLRDSQGLLHIKGCRREVLIGRSRALKFASDLDGSAVSVYKGGQAYAHLLTYVTGLLSRTRGENQVVSQFKNAYEELKMRNALSAKAMQRLSQYILHDNGVIRNHVTRSLKPAFFEACAHELSGQKGQEAVLVVANTDITGKKPDDSTENIVRYLGGKRKDAAKTIVFTHPDDSSLINVHSAFLRQKEKGKISSDVKMLPFSEAFDAVRDLQSFQRVFVCYPMDREADVDTTIIEEWGQKECFGGMLVHLGGSKKIDRVSRGKWLDPELENYISPESISDWQKDRKAQNDTTIIRGSIACQFCAEVRAEGRRPTPNNVTQTLKDGPSDIQISHYRS